ncbi:hypothetical protein UVI_02031870 [Ustilaginoidea virens]|uniref:DUF7029 domain-containing protein n=1 Tax=Ustilaginoidea virens TaxID=1159556 RepID=A0A1B5L8E5_USTVR|nr:hypothetical protein UVI_02031870 [Ustilaginoidea virens]
MAFRVRQKNIVFPWDPQLTWAGPSESGHYAFLKYYFKYPSVNIDHSDHVSIDYHSNGVMTASFKDQDAFNHAQKTWSAKDGLILIAYVPGCGGYATGERCYFNVTGLEYNHQKQTIVAVGSSKHPDQITTSGETEWGWWSADRHGQPRASTKSSGQSTSCPNGAAVASNTDADSGDSMGQLQLECEEPVDKENGLPTACLGSNFDQILDAKLGLANMSLESKAFLDGKFSTWPSNGTGAPSPGAARMRGRSLAQRGFWSKAGRFFKNVYKKVEQVVTAALSIGGGFDAGFSFKLPDRSNPNSLSNTLVNSLVRPVQSPWGDALLLKSFQPQQQVLGGTALVAERLNIYCVGCGASGQGRVAGRARWSAVKGLEEGRIELRTNMQFALKLGIEAQAQLKQRFTTDLFTYGLPHLSYGVVTIGPYVNVGARVEVGAEANGKLLVGGEIGLQDALVVMDIVNPSQNQRSGWEPYFKPVFEADGDVALTAEIGLPVGIRCGLKISTFWEKSVGIVDEPSIKGSAKISASAKYSNSTGWEAGLHSHDGCTGVLTQISWRNRLWAGLIGTGDAPVLDTGDRSLMRKCIGPAASRSTGSLSQGTRRRSIDSASVSTAEGSEEVTYNMATNHTLSQLATPDSSARVVSCANGNLYVVTNDDKDNSYCFSQWDTNQQSEIVYDGVHRSMHYYNDTMAKIGVSRLRVSDSSRVPRSSVTVAFVPLDNPDGGQRLYVAADSKQGMFFPVVCDFSDKSASKLFLVADPVEGVETLQRKGVEHSVTGGQVAACRLLPLKA